LSVAPPPSSTALGATSAPPLSPIKGEHEPRRSPHLLPPSPRTQRSSSSPSSAPPPAGSLPVSISFSAPLRRRQLHLELCIEVRTPPTLFSFHAQACRSRANSPELAELLSSASPAAVPSPSPYPPPYSPSNVRELFSFLPSHPASQSKPRSSSLCNAGEPHR
jgi:hypothetical protein